MKLVLNCGREIEFDFLDSVWIAKVDTKQEAITLNKYRKRLPRTLFREMTYAIASNFRYILKIKVIKSHYIGFYTESYATREECETRKAELYETCRLIPLKYLEREGINDGI